MKYLAQGRVLDHGGLPSKASGIPSGLTPAVVPGQCLDVPDFWRLPRTRRLDAFTFNEGSIMHACEHEGSLMLFLNRTDVPSRYLIRAVCRMPLGPLAVAAVAGVAFAGHGARLASLAAHVAFVGAQAAVRFWGRWQLGRAKARLAVARVRSAELARRR